jgi:4-hydroxybenzoate polyprenyltransferase
MKYLALIRPQQWYKNLLVFLAVVFSRNLLNIAALEQATLAFASFCALSSATYIINDYADRRKDRLNPEKWNRPLAAGTISVITALLMALALIVAGFGLALLLPTYFLYAALIYFVLSQLYTVWLKHEAFADILVISTNFVVRAVAGAFAIDVPISPWLILGVFFLALFLLLGKRRSEIILLKEKAGLHRKTLNTYSADIVARLSSIATAALVLSYTLFVFFGQHHLLYITLPIALYAIFRYDGLISTGSKVARHPEYVFMDKRILSSMLLWGLLTLIILYLNV